MKCYIHPELDAVGTCASCGRAVCDSCAVDVAGRVRCQECLAMLPAESRAGTFSQMNPLTIVSVILGVIGILGGPIFAIPAAITAWMSHTTLLQKQLQQQPLPRDIMRSLAGQATEIQVSKLARGELMLTRVGFWLGLAEVALSVLGLIFVLLLGLAPCGLCSLSNLCSLCGSLSQ